MLPEHMRETSRMELLYEDIEKLPVSEIARIAEWLTEKVDSLTTKTRAEPKEAEEEVGGAGHAALKVTWHHTTQGGRGLGEGLADCCTTVATHHDLQEGKGRGDWSWHCRHVIMPGGIGEASAIQNLAPQDAHFAKSGPKKVVRQNLSFPCCQAEGRGG